MAEPIRVLAGEPNPLTPAEMLDAGIPQGAVVTADRVNAALDRIRAAGGGQLPPHLQAKLDQLAAARAGRQSRIRDMIPAEDGGPFAEYEPGPWRPE
ncbi:hypothetical protein [Micromonospora sp. CB01531]|uniref:hypothetical protein n=1 Tax=Micromonospora sp. CB01531 TaxID=1718947 RepID=UPI00093EE40D|nr:hypothetical protein [Micromonospora sp. CB01531]OKI47221.1 hypothetical protein A6A27_10240 [Micromonospora sp. CB01531]